MTTSNKSRKKAKPAATAPDADQGGAREQLELALAHLGKVRTFRATLSARIAQAAEPAPLQAFRQKVLAQRDEVSSDFVRDVSLKIAASPHDGDALTSASPLDVTTLRNGYVELRVATALEAQLLHQIDQMQQMQPTATAG